VGEELQNLVRGSQQQRLQLRGREEEEVRVQQRQEEERQVQEQQSHLVHQVRQGPAGAQGVDAELCHAGKVTEGVAVGISNVGGRAQRGKSHGSGRSRSAPGGTEWRSRGSTG
jgi:hypothetical protein